MLCLRPILSIEPVLQAPNLMKFVHLNTGFRIAVSDRDTVQPMYYCMGTHMHINIGPITGVSQILGELVTEWSKVLQHASFERLEFIRDALQAKLNSQDADSFPKSGGHTDLGALMIKLFRDESGTQTQYTHKCNSCTRTEQWLSKTHNWTLPVEVAQNTVVFQP